MTHPHDPAIDGPGFSTLSVASILAESAVRHADRVAMLMPNVPDFARVYYAVLSLGAIVVPVHLLFKADEIAYVLSDAHADLLIAAAPLLGEAVPAAPEGSPRPRRTATGPPRDRGGPAPAAAAAGVVSVCQPVQPLVGRVFSPGGVWPS